MEMLMKKELSALTSNIDAIEKTVEEMKTALATCEKEREVCIGSEEVIKAVLNLKERVKDL